MKLDKRISMTYSYIRVSTEKQSVENQLFEIEKWAKAHEVKIDKFINETASGKIAIDHRKLGKLFKKLNSGDTLIVAELSRLGRSLLDVMERLNYCIKNDIKVIALKEKFEMGDNINSKVLAFAFSLSAEIERQLISQRTKEALARKKHEGVVLGRPKGAKTKLELHPCYAFRDKIIDWDKQGLSHTQIAKKIKVHRDTLRRWLIISGNKHLLKGRNY